MIFAVQGWDFSGASVTTKDTFILVDDVSVSGNSLVDCVKSLRKMGASINHAFVLVEETDAVVQTQISPSAALKAENVILHSLWKGSDIELDEIFKTK